MGSSGEAMSPAAQLFNVPTMNCYVIASIGSKTKINPVAIKQGLRHTLLKHPRFTSKMVMKGRKPWWIPTVVDIEKHVIVPEIDPNLDFPGSFIEDYTSNLTKTPLDSSRPLWELHLLNIKTRNSEGIGIFRIHHSLGDGASLVSLLLSVTRKSSDPKSLPTLPSKQRSLRCPPSSSSSTLWSLLLSILYGLSMTWNTLVDMFMFIATIMFLRDSQTPIKGFPGVEHSTKRFVYRDVSLDDIKLVKNTMKVTINDVLLGITQAGLARYLNRIQGANPSGGAPKQAGQNIDKLKEVRLRATILFNIRPGAGIQELADMMAEKSKVKWGNWIGYIILPFAFSIQLDPLKYVLQAKSTIDRKKHSFEAICTFGCAKLILKLFGRKVAAAITQRVLYNTTLTFSNVVGPVEEITFYGHPVTFIAPSAYGHPHALTIHFLSYVNKMTISVAAEPSLIPDPHLLCDDFEASLKQITTVVKKTLIPDIV